MKVLVTGSSGLIGSEAVLHYDALGHEVLGIDNNMRALFFGPGGDTTWNLQRVQAHTKNFQHFPIDIRDRETVDTFFKTHRPDVVVHCAAQPSHDRARDIPILDFEVNANGTLHLLEATRQHVPHAIFLHMSTNKVYGDAPNELPFVELETRYDFAAPKDHIGITEELRIDRSTHSIMGASKTAADIMAQEYGRYFGLKVGVFRGGCLTGPAHSGVQLHGFLNYLVRVAVDGGSYTIFGYKGKQVRDNIHSADVIAIFDSFIANPRPGEVYNIGGGRENSTSIIEAISTLQELAGRKITLTYQEQHRIGDHQCYITDMAKFRRDYPTWKLEHGLQETLGEMVAAEKARRKA